MSESYILFIQTELPVETVLQLIFEPKAISPLDGTTLLYARGTVFLAHAQPLAEQMQDKYVHQFGFAPAISIRYFPDGVSSVKQAMDLLAEGILRFLLETDDNVLLSANKVDVLKRLDGDLLIQAKHNFWKHNRLKMLDLPYSEDC